MDSTTLTWGLWCQLWSLIVQQWKFTCYCTVDHILTFLLNEFTKAPQSSSHCMVFCINWICNRWSAIGGSWCLWKPISHDVGVIFRTYPNTLRINPFQLDLTWPIWDPWYHFGIIWYQHIILWTINSSLRFHLPNQWVYEETPLAYWLGLDTHLFELDADHYYRGHMV